jgi:hypothetical protein
VDAPDDERATSEGLERPSLVVSSLRLVGFAFLVGGGVLGAAVLTGPTFGTLGERTEEELAQKTVAAPGLPQSFHVIYALLGAGFCLMILARLWRNRGR